jgi:hypothetical protein
MGQDVSLFIEVDKSGDPDFFIRFLDQGNALPDIQEARRSSSAVFVCVTAFLYLMLVVATGTTWSISPDMLVPPVAFTGVDVSEAMIAEARLISSLGVRSGGTRWNSGLMPHPSLIRLGVLDWLLPIPESPIDRAMREEGERLRRAFPWLARRAVFPPC